MGLKSALLGGTVIFFVETFYTTSGIDHFLFASEKGMAGGANFNGIVAKRGVRFDDITASAGDFGGFVIRMDAFLHLEPLL